MADPDPRHLRSLPAVARQLDITRTAQGLHLARQAVSGHFPQLERAVGTTLPVPTARGPSAPPPRKRVAAPSRALL